VEAIVGILFLVVLTALLSAGCAFMLHVMRPAVEWKRRAFMSALAGAAVPTVLLSLVVLLANGLALDGFVAVVAMFLMGALMGAAVCFPTAYFVTRRMERRSAVPD
jgi:hypothetical protein